ncbi:MAG: hypothetical protein J0M29_10730 [Chitinophagales bacterium]|nr:hypothetical protein [Chitinophagales bacterium]
MRAKLLSFSEYAATLLPHETAYLLEIQQFEDPAKLAILERLHQNCIQIHQVAPYDQSIDKRKYSNLKTWISDRLRENDVDAQFEWMNDMELKTMTDSIEPEEEKSILRAIRKIGPTHFFFIKFYELVQTFRHFLLIRLRYEEHRQANDFLHKNRQAYERSKNTYEQLHEATLDIVGQYSTGSGESMQWQKWLAEVLHDDRLDGLNRYLALIRLIFVHLNYGSLAPLLQHFEYMDALFTNGTYYSKRLLINYYSQRLLFHSKSKDYEKAIYYGYLSVRGKNSDYLHYLNNLASVLMRAKRHQEALQVMKSAYADVKTTRNFHSKIGFVAFYIKCLNHNQQFKNAEGYANAFLKAYKKEIFEYRWHLFFTSYLDALFQQRKYGRVTSLVQQYRLLQKDKEYQKKASYLPVIPWYYEMAAYKESGQGLHPLSNRICDYMLSLPQNSEKLHQIREFLQEVKDHIPEAHQLIQAKWHEKKR